MQNVTDSLSYNFVKCSVDAADFFDLGVSLTLRSGPGYPLYPDPLVRMHAPIPHSFKVP